MLDCSRPILQRAFLLEIESGGLHLRRASRQLVAIGEKIFSPRLKCRYELGGVATLFVRTCRLAHADPLKRRALAPQDEPGAASSTTWGCMAPFRSMTNVPPQGAEPHSWNV